MPEVPRRNSCATMMLWVLAIDAALAVVVWGAYRIW